MRINITGPKVYFTIPITDSFGIEISETVVNEWIFMAVLIGLALWLAHDLRVRNVTKRQAVAELIVTTLNNFVINNMGETGRKYIPYIGTLFAMSFMGSISGVLGFKPYTATLCVTMSFAFVTFIMTQVVMIRTQGLKAWLHSFVEPVPLMLPLNIISNAATPISMGFRHFGNIFAGTVITALIYGALGAASSLLLGWIPNQIISSIPILQVGLPAVLSVYFDWFSAFMQAYIICMLTMVFVANACAVEDAQS